MTYADFTAVKPCVSPVDGYQQKVLSADDGQVKLVYLRNYQPVSYWVDTTDGGKAENFSLRTQKPVPVVLEGLDSSYRVRLYDLETRQWTELKPAIPVGLGVTDHDFVLLMEKK